MIEAFEFLEKLEQGALKIIEDDFSLNIENKERIISLFKELDIFQIKTDYIIWRDKIPLLSTNKARTVPGSIIRRGVFIGTNAIIMPSFINIGASIGENTMIDSGVTIGSCAYIGKNCHISSNTVIAGVLEPVSKIPVIIEDNVFVGAQCLISEGIRICKNSVIAAGTILTSSTKIIDINTKKEFNHIPENSLITPGFYEKNGFQIQCAIIQKKVNAQTIAKTELNKNLRKN